MSTIDLCFKQYNFKEEIIYCSNKNKMYLEIILTKDMQDVMLTKRKSKCLKM